MISSKTHVSILRILSIFVWISLALSPWLIAVEVNDLFLNQEWLLFCLAFVSLTTLSISFLFYRFQLCQFPTLASVLFMWVVLCLSTLASPFYISLRTGLLAGCQLFLFLFLQISLKKVDINRLVWITVFSGFFMGIYSLLQSSGLDFVKWVDSPYAVVGTFSNPNYLAAYLMATALLTLGMIFELSPSTSTEKLILFLSLVPQLLGLWKAGSLGAWFCMFVGVFLFFSKILEDNQGSWIKRSPFFCGGIISAILIFSHWAFANSTANYPWEALISPPYGYRSIVTRLQEWKMGFFLFLNHPLLGIGPGGTPYLMSSFRPALGTMLGLATFNDDPHSFAISLLSETGIFGLWGFASILSSVLGVHAWKQSRKVIFEPELDKAEIQVNTDLARKRDAPTRSFVVPALALLLHGLFNNTLSVLPLTNFLVLLVATHQRACLSPTRWKFSFSFLSILYLLFPPFLAVSGWFLISQHQKVEKCLFEGNLLMKSGDLPGASALFRKGLQANPQSLHSLFYFGLALDGQKLLQGALDIFGHLDSISPNVFGVRFHISRLLLERQMLIEAHKWAFLNLEWNHAPTSSELLGRILLSEGRISEAKQVFEAGLFSKPGWAPGWTREEIEAGDKIRLQLAAINIEEENIAGAREILASLTCGIGNSPDGLYLLGLCEYKNQNELKALNFFEEAFSKDNKNPRFANSLGFLLAKLQKDLPRAKQILENAFKTYKAQKGPLLSDVLSVAHSLGILYWKLGENERARELLYAAFLECPPDWRELKEKRGQDLRRFLQETGKLVPEEENRFDLIGTPSAIASSPNFLAS
ncbi:hypothetical protein HYY75_12045 [bacterium]|nr:hypothetical protein [bacterium]